MPYASQINLNQIPPWLEGISRQNLEEASRLSRAPYLGFQGPQVAEMNPDLRRAEELSRREGLYLPYLTESNNRFMNAATPFTQNYQAYMDPYRKEVADDIATRAGRFYNETIAPSLESRFVRGGRYGGTMHARLLQRAALDLQRNVAEQQRQALSAGYQQAAQIHSTDQARQMEAGRQIGDLARQRQAGHFGDIAALENSGERARGIRQEDLSSGYRDFLQQREYPWQQISNFQSSMVGTPYSSQGMQYYHQQPEQRLNTAGQMSQLTGQLYGLNRAGGYRGLKEGGSVKPTKLTMRSGLSALKKKRKVA